MKETLSKLDNLVKEGKIIEAFDKYFTDDVITYDESNNRTTSKAEKIELLKGFFSEFKNKEEISLMDSFVNGDTTYSQFKFIFSKDSGDRFQWDEVIIRKWKDKLVFSEYYSNQDFSALKSSLAEPKKTISKTSPKGEAVAKKPAVKKTATVAKPTTKTKAKAAAPKATSAKATPAASTTVKKAAPTSTAKRTTVAPKSTATKSAARKTTAAKSATAAKGTKK